MAALPYMQLYVADYLADTTHLNAAQHGAYLLLLMNYWQRGRPLPDSNDRLAIVARMSNDEWTANREVIAEFFTVEDGCWTHHRVEHDLQKVKGISEAGRVAGLASAKARKQKASNDRSKTVEREFNHTDTDTDTEQKKPPATPDTCDTRILSESVGIFGMREQSDMNRLLAVHIEKSRQDTAMAIEHMIARWVEYQQVMPTLEWTYGSAYKFFMSGNWDSPSGWPLKNGKPEQKKPRILSAPGDRA